MKHRCYRKKMIAYLIAASMILSGAVPVYAEEEIQDKAVSGFEYNSDDYYSEKKSDSDGTDSMEIVDGLESSAEVDSFDDNSKVGSTTKISSIGASISSYETSPVSGNEGKVNWWIENDTKLYLSANEPNVSLNPKVWSLTETDKAKIESVLFYSSMEGQFTSINDDAFEGFSKLKGINIPSTITAIDGQPFKDCAALTSFSSEAADFPVENECLYTKDYKELIAVPRAYNKQLTVNGATETIRSYAACNVKINKYLSLPAGLLEIKNNAFSGCTTITGTLRIPYTVTAIGNEAFLGCTSIEVIDFGDVSVRYDNSTTASIVDIGESAFANCSSVKKIYLPSCVSNVASTFVEGNTSLKFILFYGSTNPYDTEGELRSRFGELGIKKPNKTETIYVPYNYVVVVFDPANGSVSYNDGDDVAYLKDEFVKKLKKGEKLGDDFPRPEPDDETKEFVYWEDSNRDVKLYKNSGQNEEINTDLDVIAIYKKNFTITFDPDNSDELTKVYASKDSKLSEVKGLPKDPEKGKSVFRGWKSIKKGAVYTSNGLDNTKKFSEYIVTGDDTLKAQYIDAKVVNFYSRKGTPLCTKTVSYLGVVSDLESVSVDYASILEGESPTSNYRFKGWYDSGTIKWSEKRIVTRNLNLYATYEHFYRVIYHYGSEYDAKYGTVDGDMDMPLDDTEYSFRAVHDLDGYRFDGWYTSDGKGPYGGTVVRMTDDLELTAHWTKIHNVTFKNTLDDKWVDDEHVARVTSGDSIGILQFPLDPEYPLDGIYAFDGWYTEDNHGGTEIVANEYIVNEDTSAYASWIEGYYTVQFISDGHTVDRKKRMVLGQKIGELPTKESLESIGYVKRGYKILGYNTEEDGSGQDVTSETVVTGNMRVYIIWYDDPDEENYTYYIVSFNSMGGSEVPSQRISENGLITEPSVPTRSQYKFLGWYRDTSYAEQWDFSKDVVTNDMYLYAKWMSWTDEQEAERQDNLNGIYWVKIIKNQEVSIASYFVGAAKLKAEDKKVAKVNSKKRTVKGKKAGSTLITGTFASDAEAKSVRLFVYNQTISQMSAVNTHTSMNAIDHLAYPELLPTTWKSTNAKVASIDPKTGEITVRKRGTTKIIAYYGKLKVTGKLVCGVPQFTRKYIRIVPGQTKKLRIKGVKDYTIVSYNSPSANGRQIAEIDANGMITGINAGESTISANVLGENISCKLFVQQPSLATTKLAMKLDTTKKIKLKHCKLQVVEWQSSNNGVAFVDPTNGTVYAVGKGTATIRTNAGGVTNTIVVTVTEPVKSTKDTTTRKTKK